MTVLGTPAIREAYAELVPGFERSAGHNVATTWTGTADVVKRLSAGQVFDAVIAASDTLHELTDRGHIVTGSCTEIARSGVGIAVRAGAPRPDVGSADAVKRALLAAKTIGISTGPSGVYMNRLFEQLGIAAQVKPKLKISPPGGAVAEMIVKGEADLGFQQVSEIVHVAGAQLVGPLPAEIQRVTVFSGGVHAGSREPEAAHALLRFLSAPDRDVVLR